MGIVENLKEGKAVRIAFFGDSITEGCFEGDAMPEDQQYVYHTRFCQMLRKKYPNAQIETINAGIGGNTSGMGLFRIQKDVLDKKPDFCVVCFGINDTSYCALNAVTKKMQFAKDMLSSMKPNMEQHAYALLEGGKPKKAYHYSMDRILTLLKDHNIPALVLTPNRMSLAPIADKSNPAYLLSAINAMLTKFGTMDKMMNIARTVAKAHNVPVADGYVHWKNLEKQGVVTPETYVNGTNHPNRELHQELANVLFDAFERM